MAGDAGSVLDQHYLERITGYPEVIRQSKHYRPEPKTIKLTVSLRVYSDSLSLICRRTSHPLVALPAYPVRPSSQSPVQDLSTAYSGKKGRRHAKRQP